MYKDEKIWREMINAVEIKNLEKNIYSNVIKKFSFKTWGRYICIDNKIIVAQKARKGSAHCRANYYQDRGRKISRIGAEILRNISDIIKNAKFN